MVRASHWRSEGCGLDSTWKPWFLSDEGPMVNGNARNVRLLSMSAVRQPFYISICISTLPTQRLLLNSSACH